MTAEEQREEEEAHFRYTCSVCLQGEYIYVRYKYFKLTEKEKKEKILWYECEDCYEKQNKENE